MPKASAALACARHSVASLLQRRVCRHAQPVERKLLTSCCSSTFACTQSADRPGGAAAAAAAAAGAGGRQSLSSAPYASMVVAAAQVRSSQGMSKPQSLLARYGCSAMMCAKPTSASPTDSILNCGLPSTPWSHPSCAQAPAWQGQNTFQSMHSRMPLLSTPRARETAFVPWHAAMMLNAMCLACHAAPHASAGGVAAPSS